jgi:hypothetical protein
LVECARSKFFQKPREVANIFCNKTGNNHLKQKNSPCSYHHTVHVTIHGGEVHAGISSGSFLLQVSTTDRNEFNALQLTGGTAHVQGNPPFLVRVIFQRGIELDKLFYSVGVSRRNRHVKRWT